MLSSKRQAPDRSDDAQRPPKKIKTIQETELELEIVVNEAAVEATKSRKDQLDRVLEKAITNQQTLSRLESAWNEEAGIRLIKASSLTGAPHITKRHLKRNGIAKTLRRELCRNLSYECLWWHAERTRHERDGTYTTSLATDLKHFLTDVELLASLPKGPQEAVQFLLILGRQQINWDEPLLVGPECIPGSQFFEEVKTFFITLDDKMGEIYSKSGHDPAIFAENSQGIDALIDRIEQDREAELESRMQERKIELVKTFGYHVDQFNDFEDDEGFCAQNYDDMTTEETDDFEEQLDRLDDAAAAGEQLWQYYFPRTLMALDRVL